MHYYIDRFGNISWWKNLKKKFVIVVNIIKLNVDKTSYLYDEYWLTFEIILLWSLSNICLTGLVCPLFRQSKGGILFKKMLFSGGKIKKVPKMISKGVHLSMFHAKIIIGWQPVKTTVNKIANNVTHDNLADFLICRLRIFSGRI